MHELAISTAIVDTACRHCRGQRVTAVDVQVGALRQVVPDSLDFYFEIVARDTPCTGARLVIEPVAALLRCRDCGAEWDPAPPPLTTHEGLLEGLGILPSFRCTACGAADAEVLRGSELEVESIEIDDGSGAHRAEEEQCTAPG